MSRKSVPIKMPAKATLPPVADAWVVTPTTDVSESKSNVTQLTPASAPTEPTKRLTVDVGEGLHKRIKGQCAMRGAIMADVIRELLEREFPAAKA